MMVGRQYFLQPLSVHDGKAHAVRERESLIQATQEQRSCRSEDGRLGPMHPQATRGAHHLLEGRTAVRQSTHFEQSERLIQHMISRRGPAVDTGQMGHLLTSPRVRGIGLGEQREKTAGVDEHFARGGSRIGSTPCTSPIRFSCHTERGRSLRWSGERFPLPTVNWL